MVVMITVPVVVVVMMSMMRMVLVDSGGSNSDVGCDKEKNVLLCISLRVLISIDTSSPQELVTRSVVAEFITCFLQGIEQVVFLQCSSLWNGHKAAALGHTLSV